MKQKKFLFLHRQPPLATGAECFDLAMTAAAFDQEVCLLLLDDGVYWLAAGLPELLLESVEHFGVERQSLAPRGLADQALPPSFRLYEQDAVADLIAQADIVVTG
jgi:tRNA 2-thiouridine synthesizing protein C